MFFFTCKKSGKVLIVMKQIKKKTSKGKNMHKLNYDSLIQSIFCTVRSYIDKLRLKTPFFSKVIV